MEGLNLDGRAGRDLPSWDLEDTAVLRVVREGLRQDPPVVRFAIRGPNQPAGGDPASLAPARPHQACAWAGPPRSFIGCRGRRPG